MKGLFAKIMLLSFLVFMVGCATNPRIITEEYSHSEVKTNEDGTQTRFDTYDKKSTTVPWGYRNNYYGGSRYFPRSINNTSGMGQQKYGIHREVIHKGTRHIHR